MEYSTLNKCVMAFGKANSCMDMYNNTHGAYVEIDVEHYIKIDSTIIMDVDSGIAMETHFYAEFNGKFILTIVWAISMTSCFFYSDHRGDEIPDASRQGTDSHLRHRRRRRR
jgi:hypothetical protein